MDLNSFIPANFVSPVIARFEIFLSVFLLTGLVGCSSPSYYAYSEDALDTQGYFHLLDHISTYYPSGISLNFPGYIVGIEETSRKLVAKNHEDVLIDESVYASGTTVERLLKSLRYQVPFISQIMRYEGQPYGEGNCSLYNLYHSEGATLVNPCYGESHQAIYDNNDYSLAYKNSWNAIDILKQRLAKDVATNKYTHLIIMTMGLDTPQEEAIRNYKSIISSIRKNAGHDFEPLFVGITWPSFFANRWFDPVWEMLSYSPVADRADVIGLSWLGVLLHEAILPLGNEIEISVISHSFGSRAASMGLCIGPAIFRNYEAQTVRRYNKEVKNFIGLAPAFSLRRFVDKDYPFYENVYYRDYCPMIDRVVFTATNRDRAFSMAFWSDAVGDHDYMIKFCERDQPVSVACIAATADGEITNYDPSAKLNYIDTSELMKYLMPGTRGAHSDIYRPEIGKLLWTVINGTPQ